MASISMLMAMGPLFLAAWAMIDLGVNAMVAYLHLTIHTILWPLL